VSRSFELFKVASVRMTQQHVWKLISVRQEIEFPSQTQIWKTATSVRTSGLRRSNAILDKARHEKELQPSGRQCNIV